MRNVYQDVHNQPSRPAPTCWHQVPRKLGLGLAAPTATPPAQSSPLRGALRAHPFPRPPRARLRARALSFCAEPPQVQACHRRGVLSECGPGSRRNAEAEHRRGTGAEAVKWVEGTGHRTAALRHDLPHSPSACLAKAHTKGIDCPVVHCTQAFNCTDLEHSTEQADRQRGAGCMCRTVALRAASAVNPSSQPIMRTANRRLAAAKSWLLDMGSCGEPPTAGGLHGRACSGCTSCMPSYSANADVAMP